MVKYKLNDNYKKVCIKKDYSSIIKNIIRLEKLKNISK